MLLLQNAMDENLALPVIGRTLDKDVVLVTLDKLYNHSVP